MALLQIHCWYVNPASYSEVFVNAGFTSKAALVATMGTGLVNWISAIPALYTIDVSLKRAIPS